MTTYATHEFDCASEQCTPCEPEYPPRDIVKQDLCDCGLKCIERPRFFRGQLVTDGDFNALIKWARDRLTLKRYVIGWGVVCGLHVSLLHGKEDKPDRLLVQRGYAIDPCGRDIIIPCDHVYRLKCERPQPICEPCETEEKDSCEQSQWQEDLCVQDPRQDGPWARSQKQEDLCAQSHKQEDICAQGHKPDEQGTKKSIYLCLCYEELRRRPQPRLKTKCSDISPSCEYARIKETYKIKQCPVGENRCPDKIARKYMREQYEACFEDIREIEGYLRDKNRDPQQIQKALKRLCRIRPVKRLGFVHEWIEDLEKCKRSRSVAEICFWLLQDYRLSLIGMGCPQPPECCCVRLARIDFNPLTCQVQWIYDYPPYRFELHRGPVVPSGKVDLWPYFGLPYEDVVQKLRTLGFRSIHKPTVGVPRAIKNLQDVFGFKAGKPTDLFCACPDDPVEVVTMPKDAQYLAGCVIAFRKRVKS